MPWNIPADLHSRTISGPICPFVDHSHGSLDGEVPRYDDSYACVRCVAALTEGRLEISLKKIHPQYRRRFLEFWSFVEVDEQEECWEWHGARYANGSSSYFRLPRHWSSSTQFSAPRIATWFSWGDVGRLPIRNTCDNPFCCNPLHIRVKGVPHFHHNRRISFIDLDDSARRLVADTDEFLLVTREKAPDRYQKLEQVNSEWIRMRAESPGPLDLGERHSD